MSRPNRHAAVVLLACLTAVGVAGCSSSSGDGKAAPATTTAPAASSPAPSPSDTRSETQKEFDKYLLRNEKGQEKLMREVAAGAASDPSSTETADLPDLTGLTVEAAQETAGVFGFEYFVDEDATGLDRPQVQEQEWTVCSQDPAPGVERVEVLVVLHAVKTGEECP